MKFFERIRISRPYQEPSSVRRRNRPFKAYTAAMLAGLLAGLSSFSGLSADIATSPLYVGTSVPGNLALVPSVEFPTLISVANFGDYSPTSTYTGYFDSDKCYEYIYATNEPDRYFNPKSKTTNHRCSGALWSGNYMNWAATQTIDPFRSALTGGFRVTDTASTTIVEKAIADRNGSDDANSNFPRRNFPNTLLANVLGDSSAVNAATPASWGMIRNRIDGLGNRMWFTSNGPIGTIAAKDVVAYNPKDASQKLTCGLLGTTICLDLPIVRGDSNVVYEVSVRVKVCDKSVGLESNCTLYSSGNYKPTGLLQEYSDRLLFSIFGYINNGGGTEPEGGVMRSRSKFVGPETHFASEDAASNPNREWDPDTGVFIRNPNPADATATGGGVSDSGVINYLNKFGQMKTGRVAKSYDNVSELYYAAQRYFKKQGNVPSFSTLSATAGTRYQEADGFPVITTWDDPIKYQCQANVILGIGDTNTWRDKDLPGDTSSVGEPTKVDEISGDKSVDVVKAMKQIYLMEGLSNSDADTKARTSSYNGRDNSAYIAALAYDAHTRDIRPDADTVNGLNGKQTLSTYWVDVVENRDYKRGSNQYSLAAKYGGFIVPEGFEPYSATPSPLTSSSWWSTAELVNGDKNFPRPDNFYTAAEAGKMVDSLRKAFKAIVEEIQGSGASFASDSTSLQDGATLFQSRFYSGSWRGELTAYSVAPATGALSLKWNAGDHFPTDFKKRPLYVNSQKKYGKLQWSSLSASDQATFGNDETVLDYLRGDRSREGGSDLRSRKGVLGDIIGSEPVYAGPPNGALYQGRTFTGASSYQKFVKDNADRKPVVYVGSNDGMLHGFDASDDVADAGSETYGFMPQAAINANLNSYTKIGYDHRYSVDGEMTIADVYYSGKWRTVLIGTMGRGGRSIFALDVTDPDKVDFLWEKSSADIPELGNNIGKPLVGQVSDGVWRVVVGNGPNSTGGKAQLISLDVATGAYKAIDTGVAGDNSLSAARLWDTDGDGFIDAAYAGDTKGNLWRFSNLAGTSTAAKLFTAIGPDSNVQPITAAPLLALNPKTGALWVYFGTGRYLSVNDLADRKPQTWYGLTDTNTVVADRSQLSRIEILAEVGSARAISDNKVAGARGWYMDLLSPGSVKRGERMVVPNRFQGNALVGTTRIPDSSNPCAPTGTGYVMAIDPFTGGRLPSSFFDVNGNGTVGDAGDTITINGVPVPASGLLMNTGPNSPIFVGDTMQVTMDDGTSSTKKTNSAGNTIRRVTWRELLGGG